MRNNNFIYYILTWLTKTELLFSDPLPNSRLILILIPSHISSIKAAGIFRPRFASFVAAASTQSLPRFAPSQLFCSSISKCEWTKHLTIGNWYCISM